MFNALLLISIKKGNVKRINELLEDSLYFLTYENLRIGLNAIAYLATGDNRFSVEVATRNVPELLQGMDSGKLRCTYDVNRVQKISSEQFLAMHQLVKNAKRKVYGAKEASLSPESVKDNLEVKLKESDSQLVLTVKDYGTGISADILPRIFGTYTEGGIGIGLQFVKRILDLKRGYAEVISTQPGKATFEYGTRANSSIKLAENLPQETSFALYFPKPQ